MERLEIMTKRCITLKEAVKLDPSAGYTGLIGVYLSLNRLDEARATTREAGPKPRRSYNPHLMMYQLISCSMTSLRPTTKSAIW